MPISDHMTICTAIYLLTFSYFPLKPEPVQVLSPDPAVFAKGGSFGPRLTKQGPNIVAVRIFCCCEITLLPVFKAEISLRNGGNFGSRISHKKSNQGAGRYVEGLN